MNRIFYIFSFFTLIILASCGAEIKSAKLSSSQNYLTSECACDSTYSPVCGSDGKNYDNTCVAACFKATAAKQGSCTCSSTKTVCGDDGNNYTECDAQDLIAKGNQSITKIVKFADCSAVTY
jgi:hypothetical protein